MSDFCIYDIVTMAVTSIATCTSVSKINVVYILQRTYFPTMPDDSLFHAMNVLTGNYYSE